MCVYVCLSMYACVCMCVYLCTHVCVCVTDIERERDKLSRYHRLSFEKILVTIQTHAHTYTHPNTHTQTHTRLGDSTCGMCIRHLICWLVGPTRVLERESSLEKR